MKLFPLKSSLLAALPALLLSLAAHAKPGPPPDHWVATWTTAPVAVPNPGAKFGAEGDAGTTLRQIVHISLGGPLVRVLFTNRFGTDPLTLQSAHAALTAGGSSIRLPTANALTFGGRESITIPPGAEVLSDPFALALPAGADLAISVFLPAQPVNVLTLHPLALQTSFYAAGNQVGAASLPSPSTIASCDFLKAVEVLVSADSAAIVALGDSITDGNGSTAEAHNRWPDLLAERLRGRKQTANLAVLNEGIGGNRLLHDGTGPSALARFEDVLALPGLRYVILLEGINDIGRATGPASASDASAQNNASAEDLIQAYTQLTDRAHARGLKVIGATLTPYAGAGYFSPAGEAERKLLNAFIRSNNQLDGVIDFDDATRDPNSPDSFRDGLQSGDHLHPNPAGYKAMADAINLKLFDLNKQEKYDITHAP